MPAVGSSILGEQRLIVQSNDLPDGARFRRFTCCYPTNHLDDYSPPTPLVQIQKQWIIFVIFVTPSEQNLKNTFHRRFISSDRGKYSLSRYMGQIVSVLF